MAKKTFKSKAWKQFQSKSKQIENENNMTTLFQHNKFTEGKDRKLQNRLQWVVANFINHFDTHYFPKYIQAYKNYNQINDDRWAFLLSIWQEWRSNVVTPFTKVRVDTLFSNLYTSNFELTTKPRKEEYIDKQKAYQAYLDRCFSNWENKKAVVDWIKEAINIGNWFFKIWFKVLDEMIEYKKLWNPKNKVFSLEEVAAVMKFVSPFEIFYEEDWLPFYKKRKVVYRTWMPIDEAIEIYEPYFTLTESESTTIVSRPYRFSEKDYTKYKLLTYYSESETNESKDAEWAQFDLIYHDNSYVEVVEYREKNNLVVAINWYICYDDINPNPFPAHPFLQIWFETTPWYTTWAWLWISQWWLQKSYDLIYNAYLDSVKLSVAPMFKADKWFFMDWEEQHLNYIPYKILTSRWDNKEFKRIDIVQPDPNALAALNSISNLWDLQAGTNRYNMWWQGIERSATGATMQQAIAKDKLNPLIESINNDLLTKAAEYFSLLWTKYLPERIKVRITWSDNVDKFEEITHDDLMSRFDIYFNVETFKNVAKELEKQQNLEAMQIINQVGVDPVSQRYLLKQEDIIKKSVDLFWFGANSVLSKDEYYQRVVDEELSKMRAKQEVTNTAKEEWLIPTQDQYHNAQQSPQNGQQAQYRPISWTPTDPEKFEQKIEWANTQKVDMWDILANLQR